MSNPPKISWQGPPLLLAMPNGNDNYQVCGEGDVGDDGSDGDDDVDVDDGWLRFSLISKVGSPKTGNGVNSLDNEDDDDDGDDDGDDHGKSGWAVKYYTKGSYAWSVIMDDFLTYHAWTVVMVAMLNCWS